MSNLLYDPQQTRYGKLVDDQQRRGFRVFLSFLKLFFYFGMGAHLEHLKLKSSSKVKVKKKKIEIKIMEKQKTFITQADDTIL